MKKIDFVFNLIIAVGIFLILGTAGGSDEGLVTLSEIFTFTLSGISLVSVGNAGKKLVHSLVCTPPKRAALIKRVPTRSHYENDFAA